jgi:PAS domain-containing protein
MPVFSSFSTLAGHAALLAILLCLAVAGFVLLLYHRLDVENRCMSDAIDNTSQGLSMFDAQGRITLVNQQDFLAKVAV